MWSGAHVVGVRSGPGLTEARTHAPEAVGSSCHNTCNVLPTCLLFTSFGNVRDRVYVNVRVCGMRFPLHRQRRKAVVFILTGEEEEEEEGVAGRQAQGTMLSSCGMMLMHLHLHLHVQQQADHEDTHLFIITTIPNQLQPNNATKNKKKTNKKTNQTE